MLSRKQHASGVCSRGWLTYPDVLPGYLRVRTLISIQRMCPGTHPAMVAEHQTRYPGPPRIYIIYIYIYFTKRTLEQQHHTVFLLRLACGWSSARVLVRLRTQKTHSTCPRSFLEANNANMSKKIRQPVTPTTALWYHPSCNTPQFYHVGMITLEHYPANLPCGSYPATRPQRIFWPSQRRSGELIGRRIA